MLIENRLIAYTLLALLVALVVSFLMTPIVKTFAYKVGAIDVPKDARRMHKTPIPRLGGLAIFIGFMVSILLFVEITAEMRSILLGAVIIVVLGVVDDIMALPALLKFVVQIVAALIPATHGVVIQAFSNPNVFSDNPYWVLGNLSVPLTVLWIVAITNAVNLIDGLDGLANGVSAISATTVLVIALIGGQFQVAVVMAALVGACVGFMPYNMNPAKMFMGDTGATFLGYILATMSIQGLFKFYAIISFAVPFLILGLPIFDTAFAFIRRIAHGQSPMHADRSHIHHRLIDMGLNQKQAVATLYVISAILGLSAVVLTTSGEGRAMLLFLVLEILNSSGAFEQVSRGIMRFCKTPRSAELVCYLIASVGSIVTGGSGIAIIFFGSLVRTITKAFGIDRCRGANILDGVACGATGLMPHGNPTLLLDYLDRELIPAMRAYDYHVAVNPTDLMLGLSGCHSNFLPMFRKVAEEEGVSLLKLIADVSAIDRKAPPESLLREVAGKLK